ncbi:hypothetical protein Lepto7375DRAFT_1715 [Leptolyngbya sp. PCC 7375]|nr:hypothetical protein Lepto7375DRAFT_1715 [Leptolyngbya sp. PCC 7375]
MNAKQLLVQPLKTGDITVISNVTSVTVNANKISRLEKIPGHEQESPSTVHVDFDVNQPSRLAAVLEETKELGLILELEDAVQLGIFLIAMGMENATPDDISAIMTRLSKLIADLK